MTIAKRIHVALLMTAATVLLIDGVWDLCALVGLAPMDAVDAGKSTIRVIIFAALEIWLAGYVMYQWRTLVGLEEKAAAGGAP